MLEYLVLMFAGIGAGFVTGIVGLSAVNIVAPILVIFLGYNIYVAIGIALATDVFASISSTFVYWSKGNVDWRTSLKIISFAFLGIYGGSYIGAVIIPFYLALIVGISLLTMGVVLFRNGLKHRRSWLEHLLEPLREKRKWIIFPISLVIGFIAGFSGGGGGLMILMLLLVLCRFQIHEGIGTSVLSMVLIALFGAVFHYANMSFSLLDLLICASFSVPSAYIASSYANRLNDVKLEKISGVTIGILGLGMIITEIQRWIM